MSGMTKTDIYNMALGQIGSAKVSAPGDGSREAEECDLHYPTVKDSILEELPWEFVERRQALALVSGEDPSVYSKFTYAYAYPTDCLIAERIYNSASEMADGQIEFQRYANAAKSAVYILTDQEDAYLIYTASTESFVSMRSPHLRLALIHKLAAQIAIPLKKDLALRNANLDAYFGYMAIAKNKDANESHKPQNEFTKYKDAATT
jgi:hypothetical protein